MKKKKRSATLPVLVGVGLPTESGNLPVTYLRKGVPVVVYVGGLNLSYVSLKDDYEEDDANLDEELATDALNTVKEIVECWGEYRESSIEIHLQMRDHERRKKRMSMLEAQPPTNNTGGIASPTD
jgi:hypothetical protein